MKIVAQSNQSVQSNIVGRIVAATVDASQIGMMMDMLARNYNFPHLAMLREYVSNGYDSHKESGVTRPVEVTLPTSFTPTLKVQDFGVGLSADEIENVYSVFGASTKRNDNKHIGGFGIGAKSALSVSDQFTVSSVKNGFRSVFVVTRVNGGIDYKFVAENVATEDANGVTVSIPVSSNTTYNEVELERVLSGWSSDEVKVLNGPMFTRVADDWIEFENGYADPAIFTRTNTRSTNSAQFLVGPVSYFQNSYDIRRYKYDLPGLTQRILNSAGVAFKLPIGSVTFPSSREVLESTDANRDAMLAAVEAFTAELTVYVEQKASEFKTLRDAVDFNFSRVAGWGMVNQSFKFNGQDVPRFSPLKHESSVAIGSASDHTRINFAHIYHVVENDIDASASAIKRTLNDFRRFGLAEQNADAFPAASAYAVNNAFVYGVHSDDLTDFVVELAESIDKFSEIREVVLAARREEAKRLREEKKAAIEAGEVVEDTTKSVSSIGARNVSIIEPNQHHGYAGKIQEVIDNFSDYKVYISREDAVPSIEVRKLVENYDKAIFVTVPERITEGSFQKYVVALGAEIITSGMAAQIVEDFAVKVSKRDDFEMMKKIMCSPMNSSIARRFGADVKPEIEATFAKYEEDEEAATIKKIFSTRQYLQQLKEILGFGAYDLRRGEAFAMVDIIGYFYTYDPDNIAHQQFAAYVNAQWEEHFQN